MTTNELTDHIPYATIRSIANNNHCSNLSDESVRFLTLETTGIVQFLLSDALKFTRKCRRTHMLVEDFESALKTRYLDPCFASHLSLNSNQHEISLDQLMKLPLPKTPLDISLRAHWLAIEGKQPTISENPSETAMVDSTKVLAKKRYNINSAKIKTSNPHELSLEQQIFYKEITEACVGSDAHKRQEAIHSLATETGLHQILPRLVLFICEGVKVNIQQNNLAYLKSLIQMINGLLENKSLYCEKYLHQLFPAVMSCILSKQVCKRPDTENHWELRDYAAERCALMIKMFAANVNGLRNRIVRIYLQTFHDERLPLVTYYGALVGLCEMGQETIEQLVFPIIKVLGERMIKLNENSTLSALDKNTIQRINHIVFKYIPNAYRTSHPEQDNLEYFKQEFSHYYGQRLYTSIIQLYQRQPTQIIHMTEKHIETSHYSAIAVGGQSSSPIAFGEDAFHSLQNAEYNSRTQSTSEVHQQFQNSGGFENTMINWQDAYKHASSNGVNQLVNQTMNLKEYPVNQDPNPEQIHRPTNERITYRQDVAIRYLQPPTPPPPAPVIVREIRAPQPPEAPPLIIRQRPPVPVTPPPIVIREQPPVPPPIEPPRIVNKYLPAPPPPPRKVIVERQAPLPQKPQPVIIEKWLPYKPQEERRVVVERAPPIIQNSVQKNTVITYDAPRVDLVKNVRELGTVRVDPQMYVAQYGTQLASSEYVLNTMTKFGLGNNYMQLVQMQTSRQPSMVEHQQLTSDNHAEYIEKHVDELVLLDGRRRRHSSVSGTNEQEVLRQAELFNLS